MGIVVPGVGIFGVCECGFSVDAVRWWDCMGYFVLYYGRAGDRYW